MSDRRERYNRICRGIAGLVGALGVAAAAFGAHGLQKIASPEQVRWWAIGAALHLLTAPVLLQVCVRETEYRAPVRYFLAAGLLLFSGSLYVMTLGGPRVLGAVTPLGGLCLMIGWSLAGLAPDKAKQATAKNHG